MITWNYRVFREENGDYIIREVFYDENGAIITCTLNAVEPLGSSLEELAADLASFQEALHLPILTLADIPTAPPDAEPRRNDRSGNRSLEEVMRELELTPST
jgi:hypothetical protein